MFPISIISKHRPQPGLGWQWFISGCFPAFSAASKQFITAEIKQRTISAWKPGYTVEHASRQTQPPRKNRTKALGWASKLLGPFGTELFHQAYLSVSWGKTSVSHQLGPSQTSDGTGLGRRDGSTSPLSGETPLSPKSVHFSGIKRNRQWGFQRVGWGQGSAISQPIQFAIWSFKFKCKNHQKWRPKAFNLTTAKCRCISSPYLCPMDCKLGKGEGGRF